MSDIKYLGVQGLEELIILTQNALAKKADVLQFDVMPDPTKYIGKIVQYVGVSDISFTRSHFYYSNGIKWAEENTSGEQTPKIEMVAALPSWVDADPQALYILKNTADITMNFYVKNQSVNDAWFTVEKSISFVVVASLPQWADADSSIIYFKANGNDLVGYIKNTYTIDAWYTFGEKPQIIIDTAMSATSTNPLQNKVIFTEIQGLRSYVENQNLLYDFEDITISHRSSAPTRMEYDGYVTVVIPSNETAATQPSSLYINGTCVGCTEQYAYSNNGYTGSVTAITVFVAKNDDLYLLCPLPDCITKARFYKLRDYTNRPYKE